MEFGKEYPKFEDLVFTQGTINLLYPPVPRSIYHEHMKRWLDIFPREQLHIVNGDSLIKEPWTEIQKLEHFLNISAAITEKDFFFNPEKGFYCMTTKHQCLSKTKGRPKPPLEPETEAKLKEFYRPHNLKFEQMINQTFGWAK